MTLRARLSRQIDRKRQEIQELELKIREGNAYIQALQDTLKHLPQDAGEAGSVALRPGSDIAKARDAIRAAGGPLHITALLKAQGKSADKKNRLGLGGSLSRYARKGIVFIKTAPNTFGLLEAKKSHGSADSRDFEPPDDFGQPE